MTLMELLGMKIRKKVRRLVDDCAQTDTKNIDDKEI